MGDFFRDAAEGQAPDPRPSTDQNDNQIVRGLRPRPIISADGGAFDNGGPDEFQPFSAQLFDL